jgi:hypothetical protein
MIIVLVNVRLYPMRSGESDPDRLSSDILPQLYFLADALQKGAGERMQKYFPEGFFFTHALYGLAWIEVGMRQEYGSSIHTKALEEAQWALDRLGSPKGRAPFTSTIDPPLGVFYLGWSSWLRGGMLKLQPSHARDPAELARFVTDCMALAESFHDSSTPFLPSYPGQSWPVDSVVAVAALCLHDRLFRPRFIETINKWLLNVRLYLDPATGLLPHSVNPETGLPIQGARGSSQTLINRFLLEIDPHWGLEQYTLFRQQFVSTLFGMPGVREYPRGVSGQGDVDSGPLLGGISLSATVVTIGPALLNVDQMVAGPLLNLVEAIGFPISWGNKKRYGFGLLPVGDAFLVWTKTAISWIDKPQKVSLSPIFPWWWRLPLHGLALCIMALVWWLMWRKPRKKLLY